MCGMPALTGLAIVTALIGVALYDLLQRKRAILRTFPIIGHFRYLSLIHI